MSKPFLFKTKKFSKTIKGETFLSEKTCSALVEIGLPRWVAPHLYFGEFEQVFLPKLRDWPWLSDWEGSTREILDAYGDCRVIGSSDEHAPIFLNRMKMWCIPLCRMFMEKLWSIPMLKNSFKPLMSMR